jgi:hypothetical protein
MSRCTKYSLAWGLRCALEAGHVDDAGKPSICSCEGEGFWGTCSECDKRTECVCHPPVKEQKKGK